MQLPDWTALGQPVPTPSFRRVIPDASGQILDAGIQDLAKGAGEVANQQYAQNVNLARAQASNALLDHEIAVKSTAEQIHQDVASGKLPYDQARATYDKQVADIPAPQIQNLDPVGQVNLQKGLQRNIATSGFAIDGAVQTARQNDFKDQFAGNLDKLGKLAGMPDADIQGINEKAEAFRPLAREAGLPAAFIDGALDKFKEQNWFNNANQRAMTNKDNAQGLKVLQHDLVDNDGFYANRLDTNKRNEVLRGVVNDQLILENRAEHLQEKREAHAAATINQIGTQISSGIPATPQMWSKWEADTKGTQMEDEFKQSLAGETQVQAVLRQPVDQQISYVQQRTQELDTQGGSLRDRANLNRLATAVNQNVNMMQKTPLLFSAVRNGTDVQPLPLQDIGKPEGQQAIGAQVADRMATLSALRKQYGPQISLTPLLPQEVGQITSQLANAPATQQAQILNGLRTSFGNDQAFGAAMHQIAPHDPVAAISGEIGARTTPQTRPVWFDRSDFPVQGDVQGTILAGRAALNPSADEKGDKKAAFPMPPPEQLRAQWSKATGDLFRGSPHMEEDYYDAFRSYYAGAASAKGDYSGGGAAKLPDSKLVKEAADAVLGKVMNYNGANVSIPYGMSESKFKDFVPEAIRDRMASAGYGEAEQKGVIGNFFSHGAQLTQIGLPGSGRYYVTSGNHDLVDPKTGQKMIVDLYNQYDTSQMGAGPRTRGATPAQQGVIDRQVQQDSNGAR